MKVNCIINVVLALAVSGCAVTLPVAPDPVAVQQAATFVDQGTLLLRAGALDRAEARFRLALEVALIPEGFDGLGCVELMRGNFASAEQLFLASLKQDPDYAEAQGNLALLYELRGEKERAATLYHGAVASRPLNVRMRHNFAGWLSDNGGHDRIQMAREQLLRAQSVSDDIFTQHELKRLGSRD